MSTQQAPVVGKETTFLEHVLAVAIGTTLGIVAAAIALVGLGVL